ncbi:asparaginyl-tRNA synthetase [Saxophila tyrrhenica]|uniref:asparagine--tRNA ligase n=1 Tax=Saxophila tyrrhenica TaxID=1690608 RepID=A0AAV9PHF2_9PEZI|nr:asparaginyl-tRNA synthetase [Saxophila tyrrhenica]
MRAWRTASRSWLHGRQVNSRPFSGSSIYNQRRDVADILKNGKNGDTVSATGWVRSVRKQKRIAFAAVGDGSTTEALQAVLKPEDAAELSHGTAVELKGEWKASVGSKQSHELQVSSLDVLGKNDAESNPLQPKYQTPEYLRSIPHLRPRIATNALLLRLRSKLIASLTNFFDKQNFVQCHTPIITSSDCEGAGEVFTVSANASKDQPVSKLDSPVEHFFRTPKYLTVSAQLHLEALAQAVSKVWTLSPTFRAEQSDTPRHLSEFYMLEAEICFTSDLSDIMDVVENMLRSSVTSLQSAAVWTELLNVKQTAPDDDNEDGKFVTADVLQQRWDGMAALNWPRITYAEAIDMLEDAKTTANGSFTFEPSYRNGLQAEHERYIATSVGKGRPVFVTDYPRVQKPFYMPPSVSTSNSKGSPDTVACFDLLVPDLCELAGGSIREHGSKELLEAMRQKGVVGKDLEWYQDLRKYSSVPHGGFGLGFDRLICYLAGVANVRDVVAFPRWFGRADC